MTDGQVVAQKPEAAEDGGSTAVDSQTLTAKISAKAKRVMKEYFGTFMPRTIKASSQVS